MRSSYAGTTTCIVLQKNRVLRSCNAANSYIGAGSEITVYLEDVKIELQCDGTVRDHDFELNGEPGQEAAS